MPGLTIPGGTAKVVSGFLTDDMRTLKEGWSEIRPDKMAGIIRQLENLAQGKTDWLSLFIYLNPEKSGEGKRWTPATGRETERWTPPTRRQ